MWVRVSVCVLTYLLTYLLTYVSEGKCGCAHLLTYLPMCKWTRSMKTSMWRPFLFNFLFPPPFLLSSYTYHVLLTFFLLVATLLTYFHACVTHKSKNNYTNSLLGQSWTMWDWGKFFLLLLCVPQFYLQAFYWSGHDGGRGDGGAVTGRFLTLYPTRALSCPTKVIKISGCHSPVHPSCYTGPWIWIPSTTHCFFGGYSRYTPLNNPQVMG